MLKIQKIKTELAYYRALTTDHRTPIIAKWLIVAAIAYLLMPFDLIPDFIPILGQLDDLIIVPGLVWLGLRCIPQILKQEIRLAVEKEHNAYFSE
ncbi:MAG: uncharacterized membrane protein YkvA (DUF1232 family) [Methylophagaceae bacterium]|jgi:uncharacterized membrane protein YkvA (DUF1232 family)